MNCDQIRELLPDVAAGMNSETHEVETHIASCSACAAKLQGFRQTMTLLDEWKAPEPSPYFDTRLGALLREETARPARSWLHALLRPSVAGSVAAVLIAAGTFALNRDILFPGPEERIAIRVPVPGVPAEPGTALGDLQALEKNHDLYADFDILDELQVQAEVTANP